ncbi:hypothetical protein [Arthrobacter sp. EPSL27]|uniref:hypothetical protein n=1 Tax=Arthrobacter sp. EPSL27 TaxID=1745378 RepID=UPI000ACC4C2A|nr:hypothetical protein [Arthrobacter sp. EPSL27]
MTPNERNHARDRIYGDQPFDQTYTPGADDFRRWLLTDAERIVKAEAERVNDALPNS